MRKVVAGLFIALDGVAEAPDKWQFEFDEQMGQALDTTIGQQDAILLGRLTYEAWAPYWPTTSNDLDFAHFINNTPKYVVSTTLERAEWGQFEPPTVIANLAEGITRLKQQPGKNIGVAGSPSVVRSLIEADLLDELQLLIHPTIAGSGKRLFGDNTPLKRMTLVESKPTSSGVVIATYHPYKGHE
jgi:dihydrofolate reductase